MGTFLKTLDDRLECTLVKALTENWGGSVQWLDIYNCQPHSDCSCSILAAPGLRSMHYKLEVFCYEG